MSALMDLIVILVVWLVVLLICREIVCWYWKMNETVKVLKEIRDLLKCKNIEYLEIPKVTKD